MSKAVSTILYLVAGILIVVGVVLLVRGGGSPEPAQESAPREEPFAEQVNYEIIGIEPGAGIMSSTETALEEYGLGEAGWTLKSSSAAAMLAALRDSMENNEPILATVWEPHSAFALPEGDLRKLDDPENVYNDPEATRQFLEENAPQWADTEVQSDVLASVVYKGFQEDAPAAYAFLENFQIPADTQSDWIYQLNVEEKSAEDIADAYTENHADRVDGWKPDTDALGKKELTMGIPPWPGVTVKSQVAKNVLEEMGYSVDIQEMEAGVVYTSLADQQVDMNLAGWLPTTHGQYWDKHQDQLAIAGINVTKTWLGLGVPDYVDESVQSITDLK